MELDYKHKWYKVDFESTSKWTENSKKYHLQKMMWIP